MEVKLLTPHDYLGMMENFAALADLTCHANTEKEYKPSEVLGRIIKLGHESILEHINLTYSVKGLSSACLQELERHRHISLSVENTRHTLHKYLAISDDELGNFVQSHIIDLSVADDMKALLVLLMGAGLSLGVIKRYENFPNYVLKYLLPELWPTNLILTANIRALRHIIKLHTAPTALKEFRDLAHAMFREVPDEYKYLLEDCVYKENGHE